MKIIISESILKILKEEYVGLKTIPINNLLVSQRGLKGTYSDIIEGRYSKTKGPLKVWMMDGEYQLIDGYHRLFQYLLLGVRKVKVKVYDGYSDYWAKTADYDKFNFNLDLEFGGLEVFGSNRALSYLRDKVKMDGEN